MLPAVGGFEIVAPWFNDGQSGEEPQEVQPAKSRTIVRIAIVLFGIVFLSAISRPADALARLVTP
jgi:hypothetical protein